MRHEHSKRVIFITLAVFFAVLVLAKLFGTNTLALLVLLCPIMMIAMMFGMNHDHKR